MATLNAVIVPAKVLKGGKHKVRISVAHNGETRYIVTNIIIDSDKEWRNGQVVKRPDAAMKNTRIRQELQKHQEAIDELQYVDGMTCAELVYQLKTAGNYKHRTLASIYEEYVANSHCVASTLYSYKMIWQNISQYLGDKMMVEHITHGSVLGLDKHLRTKMKPTSVRTNVAFLMVLLNYAKRCGYVQFRVDPFFGYELPKTERRQSWITVEEVKRIRDIKTTKRNIIKCRDMFMLSYYLGGINIVDLIDIDFNQNSDVIRYERKKTVRCPKINKYVEFEIPDEAKEIINCYKGADGRLRLSKMQKVTTMHYFLDYNMRKLAKLTGIKNLIYYSARKSFSQHAFDLGISTSIIDFILG
ncbi:MAG: recombinase, partial [Bacteroidales bacterium]|nr:recombinase [Bacteroidales bacterium]